jgi:hypothetical protein
LSDPDAQPEDDFGEVAISGGTAIVGANDTDYGAGAAYIYARGSGGVWPTKPTVTFSDPGATAGDLFGSSVAIGGNTALVGEPRSNVVYVFVRVSRVWKTAPKSTMSDPSHDAGFGASVALAMAVGVVGDCSYGGSSPGSTYLYTKRGASWPVSPTASLSDPNSPLELLGDAVAMTSTKVIATDDQSAYIYLKSRGSWWTTASTTLSPTGPPTVVTGVGISSTNAIVGDDAFNQQDGAAYIYLI